MSDTPATFKQPLFQIEWHYQLDEKFLSLSSEADHILAGIEYWGRKIVGLDHLWGMTKPDVVDAWIVLLVGEKPVNVVWTRNSNKTNEWGLNCVWREMVGVEIFIRLCFLYHHSITPMAQVEIIHQNFPIWLKTYIQENWKWNDKM